MLLVLIDVDGFMGQLYNENGTQTILIPREVVIFYWEKIRLLKSCSCSFMAESTQSLKK